MKIEWDKVIGVPLALLAAFSFMVLCAMTAQAASIGTDAIYALTSNLSITGNVTGTNNICLKNGSNCVTPVITAGGSNGSIQFNNNSLIVGTTSIMWDETNRYLNIKGSSTKPPIVRWLRSDGVLQSDIYTSAADNSMNIINRLSADMRFSTNAIQRMKITAAGNVEVSNTLYANVLDSTGRLYFGNNFIDPNNDETIILQSNSGTAAIEMRASDSSTRALIGGRSDNAFISKPLANPFRVENYEDNSYGQLQLGQLLLEPSYHYGYDAPSSDNFYTSYNQITPCSANGQYYDVSLLITEYYYDGCDGYLYSDWDYHTLGTIDYNTGNVITINNYGDIILEISYEYNMGQKINSETLNIYAPTAFHVTGYDNTFDGYNTFGDTYHHDYNWANEFVQKLGLSGFVAKFISSSTSIAGIGVITADNTKGLFLGVGQFNGASVGTNDIFVQTGYVGGTYPTWFNIVDGNGVVSSNIGLKTSIINVTSTASPSNSVTLDQTNALRLTGTTTVYNDMVAPLTVAHVGATAPSFDEPQKAYRFADGASQQYAFVSLQLPHSYMPSTNIGCHLHIRPDGTLKANVTFQLNYTWSNIEQVMSAGTTTTLTKSQNFTSGVAYNNTILDFGQIAGTGKTESSSFIAKLTRLSNTASDTYTGSVYVDFLDCHYQLNKLGTNDEYS